MREREKIISEREREKREKIRIMFKRRREEERGGEQLRKSKAKVIEEEEKGTE